MAIYDSPTYVDADTFTVNGDHTSDEGGFDVGRKLRMDCGADGIKYGHVESTSYSDPDTTVNLTSESDSITSNLTEVITSPVKPGDTGNLPKHDHSNPDVGGALGTLQGDLDFAPVHGITLPSGAWVGNKSETVGMYFFSSSPDIAFDSNILVKGVDEDPRVVALQMAPTEGANAQIEIEQFQIPTPATKITVGALTGTSALRVGSSGLDADLMLLVDPLNQKAGIRTSDPETGWDLSDTVTQMTTTSGVANPGAGKVRIYAKAISGTVKLCALFPSGNEQIIASEP